MRDHVVRQWRWLALGCVLGGVCGASAESIGPDVIVGDLYDLTYWGNSGGIYAYSVGTKSCNIGDTPLLWQNNTNQRPVIAQNMYRLKDGRFEQIGQSWCKWSFTSLNQSFCGPCQHPGTSALLGVGCSDPYSANLNGSQSRLGPKSVVNPFTGDFPSNHTTPGTTTIAGRLQVHVADIQAAQNAGATYYVEGQYVTPDDAAAGNLYNNASYRQVWLTGSLGLTFSNPQGGSSATVREKPAILAWQAADPAVGVALVDVPGDGQIYVAHKATNLGGGQWRYEIAIFNLNSDRAIGAVEVKLPDWATVGAVGFHDVDYHSGEPYANTDWISGIREKGVFWTTEAYTENANANALRWGTLYNFRFDSDAAPTFVTEAVLTLFKPGTPATITAVFDNGAYRLGDMNCDGALNFKDINPFVQALGDPGGWQAAHPGCPLENLDIDGNGSVDFKDINPFVSLLAAQER